MVHSCELLPQAAAKDVWCLHQCRYGENLVGSTALRSDWNVMVLKEIMAPAFAKLVAALAAGYASAAPCSDYFQLWPETIPSAPFSFLIESLYRLLAHEHVVFTAGKHGKWLVPTEAFYMDDASSR